MVAPTETFSDAQKPKVIAGHLSDNPPYDAVDIKAGTVCGDVMPVDQLMLEQFVDANFDRVLDSLMQPGVIPANDAKAYFAILKEPHGTLTFRPGEGEAILIFTSENRAKHYVTEVKDLEISGEVGIVHFSADDWQATVEKYISSGITHLIIDKCPYCDAFNVIEITSVLQGADLTKVWAIFKTTKTLMYDFYLREAEKLFTDGKIKKARSICEQVVTYTDAERPEVHLLLAKCGIKLKDRDLVNRKRKVLKYFGQRWDHELQKLEK